MTVQQESAAKPHFMGFSVDTIRDDSYTGLVFCVFPKGLWNRMQRFLITRQGPSPTSPITEFYREEFIKHQLCLQQQREYFSSQAIDSVESALVKVIAQVDALSTKADADQVVAKLLREFDLVTRLSDWSDPHKAH